MSMHSDTYIRDECGVPLCLQHNIRLCDEGAPCVVRTREGWRWCGLCCAWRTGNHGGPDKHTKRLPYCFMPYSRYGPDKRTIFRNPDGSAMFNGRNFGLAAAAANDDSSLMADNLPAASTASTTLPSTALPSTTLPSTGELQAARNEIQRLDSELQAARNEIQRLDSELQAARAALGGDIQLLSEKVQNVTDELASLGALASARPAASVAASGGHRLQAAPGAEPAVQAAPPQACTSGAAGRTTSRTAPPPGLHLPPAEPALPAGPYLHLLQKALPSSAEGPTPLGSPPPLPSSMPPQAPATPPLPPREARGLEDL